MSYEDAVALAWLVAYGSVVVSAIACVAIAARFDRKIRRLLD